MEETQKNSKVKWNLFVTVDILNIERKICLPDAFFCYNNLLFTYVISVMSLVTFFSL